MIFLIYGMGEADIKQTANSYIKKRGFKLFLIRASYMLIFALALAYTIFRSYGATISDSLYSTSSVFTLPILFIIGFALAMIRFWYSIPWFIFATVVVNSLIFNGINGGVLTLTAIEVPIFLIVTLLVFGVERGFSAIPKKWLRVSLALLPFVIMLITIFLTYFR